MNKLAELISSCKGPVSINVNQHRGDHETANMAWENLRLLNPSIDEDTGADVVAMMLETDTIVSVHFYPETMVGFFQVYHYDLEAALTAALACFNEPAADPTCPTCGGTRSAPLGPDGCPDTFHNLGGK